MPGDKDTTPKKEETPQAAAAVPKPQPEHHGAFSLQQPKNEEVWSHWYVEAADNFDEFQNHEAGGGMTPTRQLSSRQLSGQFEDDVAKTWEEDWEDEDTDDTYDAVMTQISIHSNKK